MRTRSVVVVAVLVGMVSLWAKAEIETIGPITVVPNQPIELKFPNKLPPDPDHKILEFIGKGYNGSALDAVLWVGFDYEMPDATGAIVVGHTPPQPFVILPGQSGEIQIQYELPFCPPVVSLDFRLVDIPGAFVALEVGGKFRHECIEVPEPGSAMAGVLGVGLLLMKRRRV